MNPTIEPDVEEDLRVSRVMAEHWEGQARACAAQRDALQVELNAQREETARAWAQYHAALHEYLLARERIEEVRKAVR